jgi:putative oxidoreductase
VLLALGLVTPLAAALTLSVMIVAAVSVHMKNGFFITESGFEYNLVVGVAALTLAFTGPRSWSLDAVLGWNYGSEAWGVAALAVAAIGAATQLAQRRSAGTHDMFARAD